ncbi:MAG: hypothetical protein MHPSP_000579 [Paramarteilia canceri]
MTENKNLTTKIDILKRKLKITEEKATIVAQNRFYEEEIYQNKDKYIEDLEKEKNMLKLEVGKLQKENKDIKSLADQNENQHKKEYVDLLQELKNSQINYNKTIESLEVQMSEKSAYEIKLEAKLDIAANKINLLTDENTELMKKYDEKCMLLDSVNKIKNDLKNTFTSLIDNLRLFKEMMPELYKEISNLNDFVLQVVI